MPDLTNPVLPPIVRGIEETLWAAGLACLVADTDNDVEREAVAVRELQARRCEGLVIASATRDSATVRALAGGDVPAVLVTRDVDGAGLPFVAGDDAAGVAGRGAPPARSRPRADRLPRRAARAVDDGHAPRRGPRAR